MTSGLVFWGWAQRRETFYGSRPPRLSEPPRHFGVEPAPGRAQFGLSPHFDDVAEPTEPPIRCAMGGQVDGKRINGTPSLAVSTLLALLLVGGFAALFAVAVHRSNELFVLNVTPGVEQPVTFVRGRVPPRLLQDLRDLLAASGARGKLRALVVRGAPTLEARGDFSIETLQRARNLLGLYPLAKLRAGVTPVGNAGASRQRP